MCKVRCFDNIDTSLAHKPTDSHHHAVARYRIATFFRIYLHLLLSLVVHDGEDEPVDEDKGGTSIIAEWG